MELLKRGFFNIFSSLDGALLMYNFKHIFKTRWSPVNADFLAYFQGLTNLSSKGHFLSSKGPLLVQPSFFPYSGKYFKYKTVFCENLANTPFWLWCQQESNENISRTIPKLFMAFYENFCSASFHCGGGCVWHI